MKQVTINVYKFNELSEEGKKKALKNYADINVDYGWWDYIYEDAKKIGLKITSFELYPSYITSKKINHCIEIANKILKNHGEGETHKLATQFLKEWDELVEKYSDGVNKDRVKEGNEDIFDEKAEQLEDWFLTKLDKCYSSMLLNDYEHRTSEEGIIETFEANDYDFTDNGKIY